MKPGMKFAIGALVIVGSVSYMIFDAVKTTGTYFVTPTELMARAREQPDAYYNQKLKVSAKVVPGSVRRDPASHRIDFAIEDSTQSIQVTYVGGPLADTFTDANDIDVVVDGELGRDGRFRATDVLAKCGSRYDAVMQQAKQQARKS